MEPLRRRRRALLVFATTVAVALGGAGPALATELPGPPPMPEVALAVPAPEAPPLPIPVPDIDLQPVVETQVEAGNVDVSVRVLSPGEDAAVSQDSATAVVSPVAPPDITAAPQPDGTAGGDSAAPAGGTNTNVSIRVLSPGDRGDVTQVTEQITGGSGEEVVEAGPESALPQPDPAPASTAPSSDASDSSQYQPDDFRYQSGEAITYDPWNWAWVLSLDCSGNASSTSRETGHQESLVWSWEWVWEWGCSDADAGGSNAESGDRAPPPAEAGRPAEASSPGSDEAAVEPWDWTWTFTFCGETRTISTHGGTGTPLTWTWDWTWKWTCPTPAAVPGVQPPPAIDMSTPLVTAPPTADAGDESTDEAQRALQLAGDAPATTLPTVWLPSVSLGLGAGASVQMDIATPLPPSLEIEVAIPPVVLPVTTAPPLPSPTIPFPAADVAAEPATTAPAVVLPADATITPQPAPKTSPRYGVQPSHSQPPVHHAKPAKQPRTRAESSKRDRQQLPLERRQSRQALGSSSAGGIVPSALLFGFAALTGFIVLAAPGLGRRIRAPRTLRPPDPDLSPIEHPG